MHVHMSVCALVCCAAVTDAFLRLSTKWLQHFTARGKTADGKKSALCCCHEQSTSVLSAVYCLV